MATPALYSARPESPLDDSPPVPGARKALVLLLAINLLNYMDRYVLASLVNPIQNTFFPGVTGSALVHARTLMGSLASAFLISYMIAAPIFGWLADRTSRWMLVGIGVLVWSLATGAGGIAPFFAVLFITRMCVGIGEAAYGPAAPTLISDSYPIKRRGAVLAWFYMAIPVGSAIGYAVGELVNNSLGWRAAFFVVTPPGILLGLICLMMRDPPRGQTDVAHAITRRAGIADYLRLLKIPSYLIDSAGMIAMTFAVGGISFWMPGYLDSRTDVHGPTATIFGGITALAGLSATLLGGIAGDKLRSRFGGSYFIVSGAGLLMACPFILLISVTPFPYAWGIIFLAVFFLFFNTGPSNTILANVTHPSIRATAFALNIFIIHALGDVTAPPLIGWISKWGWNCVFYVVAAATALGGLIWLYGARYLVRDTALAAADIT